MPGYSDHLHCNETAVASARPANCGGKQRRICRALLSGIPVELALLGDPFVRLVGALDTILPVIAFGWKMLRDLVDDPGPGAAIGPGCVKNVLADLESMVIAQVPLHLAEKRAARRRGGADRLCLLGS